MNYTISDRSQAYWWLRQFRNRVKRDVDRKLMKVQELNLLNALELLDIVIVDIRLAIVDEYVKQVKAIESSTQEAA